MRASTRKDIQDYVQVISKSYFTAPKVFWSFVNRDKVYQSPLLAVNFNGSLIDDDLMKANIFNTYFGSVKMVLTWRICVVHSRLIDSIMVLHLKSMNCCGSCGPNLLPTKLLKEGAEEISHSLPTIFNLSCFTSRLDFYSHCSCSQKEG